jgi:hypothetical protein
MKQYYLLNVYRREIEVVPKNFHLFDLCVEEDGVRYGSERNFSDDMADPDNIEFDTEHAEGGNIYYEYIPITKKQLTLLML